MNINILGYGVMGKQIAALLFLAGYDIFIWDNKEMKQDDVYKQIKFLKKYIESRSEGVIHFVDSLLKLEDNLTIEAVIEDLETKRQVYKSLKSKLTKPYFTNTSSLSPLEIGDNVNAMHFFNPISLKIIELYLCDRKVKDKLTALFGFLKSVGFEIINVNKNRGYLGNSILFREISSALKLIEKFGYAVEDVNRMYKKLYVERNIFTIINLIGVDVVYKILVNLKDEDEAIYLPDCLELALQKNILGKKNKTSILQVLQ